MASLPQGGSDLLFDATAAWKQRFRVPAVAWTELAGNNIDRGLVISDQSGMSQLYAWDVRTGNLQQLTNEPKGKVLGQISPDGKYIYYLKDEQGNELGHFVRIPFEGGAPEDITPELPAYSSTQLAFCRGNARLAFTRPERGAYHLYRIDELTGGANGRDTAGVHEAWSSTDFTTSPVLSFDGRLAAVASRRPGNFPHYSLLLLDLDTGELLSELSDGPGASLIPHRFSPIQGDGRLLLHSTRGGSKRPLLWDPKTNERFPLQLDRLEGDIAAADWADDGRRLLLSQQARARQQLFTYDLLKDVCVQLDSPPGTCDYYGSAGCYFAVPGEIWCNWQDSAHPASLIALSDEDGRLLKTILPSGPVLSGHPWSSVQFPSSDGQTIQGWLGLPEGDGPFPTILEMHGGPEMAQMDMFSPRSQAWLDTGYAFLTINYRGSSSFGRQFQEQIWGDQGHWEVEDMVAAHRWLVEKRIALPDLVFLTGWSYGGYLTLLALGKHPELWAGGMAGHVISDWAAQYVTTSDRMAGAMVAFFGGTPADKPDLYRAASPITFVDNVRAPVLIIQARDDTRSSPEQATLFAERLQKSGGQVEVHWAQGGHVTRARDVEIQHQELMMRFAERVRHG